VALLNIAALSQRTGVAPDTLRKWEERYGVLRPERTSGRQRRYSELDVARVEWLQGRLAEGYRIGEAAALLSGVGSGAPATPRKLRAALREATDRGDTVDITRLLDHAFSLRRLEDALAGIVQPLLDEVGRSWKTGDLTAAQEHLISQAIRIRFSSLLADPRAGVRGTAVLACAPGEQHDIGLTAFAALLHADGWRVAFLGADTPVDATVKLAHETGARVICISATMREGLEEFQAQLREVERPAGIELLLGGAAVTARAVRRLRALSVDGDLAGAMRSLRRVAR
jgi:methanogenic corrinoid protein MtbC1